MWPPDPEPAACRPHTASSTGHWSTWSRSREQVPRVYGVTAAQLPGVSTYTAQHCGPESHVAAEDWPVSAEPLSQCETHTALGRPAKQGPVSWAGTAEDEQRVVERPVCLGPPSKAPQTGGSMTETDSLPRWRPGVWDPGVRRADSSGGASAPGRSQLLPATLGLWTYRPLSPCAVVPMSPSHDTSGVGLGPPAPV